MKPVIEIAEASVFAGVVADEIATLIAEKISEKGHCSVVLSGGKTPGTVYRHLALPPRVSDIEWDKVSFFLGDERFVPQEDVQSNFRMIRETLILPLKGKNPTCSPVNTSCATAEEAAASYGKTISQFFKGKTPHFDVVLLGLGEDGHCASLFPGSPALRSANIAEAVDAPEGGVRRITLTPNILFSAGHVLFIVKGENKSQMVKRVLEGDEPIEVIPARLFATSKSQVSWFLDSAAGTLVRK
jgi:6-phosphogluconolactonase